MASEDVFNGAKTAMMFLDAYVNTVGQEIGMERALGLFTKTCENMGAPRGKMMKEQSGMKQFDARAAWSLLKSLKDSFGFSCEVLEQGPTRVVVRNNTCPFYEAAQTLGIDAKAIEASFCRGGPIRTANAAVKQLNANLSVQVRKFRSAINDFCEEEIIIS